MDTDKCGAEYPSWEGLRASEREWIEKIPELDHRPRFCFRQAGHGGSHIAETDVHANIWDDEIMLDFYAPDGFGAVCQSPRAVAAD